MESKPHQIGRQLALALVVGVSLAATVISCSRGNDASDAGEATSAGAPHQAVAAAPVRRPDPPRLILLISLDTVRADHLGVYGYERFTSPVLDSLATEGVLFDDVTSTAPWTLPAHASMLTGRYPLGHEITSMKTGLPDRIPTLTELLASAGYDTAAIVNTAWLKKTSFRVTRGFDKYLFVRAVTDRKAPSHWITEQAIEWIDEMGSRPLFLFVHYYDVHSDYTSLPEFERLFVSEYDGHADGTGWQLQRAGFSEAYIEMCANAPEENKDRCRVGGDLEYYVVDHMTAKVRFDEGDLQHLTDLYDSGVRQLDTEISRLFAHLHEKGLLDETLLVVTSDHGEGFGEHGEVDHFLTTYQEVLHVPLLVRGKGIPANMRIEQPVSLVDIVPTILSQAGVRPPADLDGRDLSPLWRGEQIDEFEHRTIFAEGAGGVTWQLIAPGFYPEYRALRRGRYKMIYSSDGDRYSLYDLSADPGETVDLAKREPELHAELRREMKLRYRGFSGVPTKETQVEMEQEDIDNLRALGYIQ